MRDDIRRNRFDGIGQRIEVQNISLYQLSPFDEFVPAPGKIIINNDVPSELVEEFAAMTPDITCAACHKYRAVQITTPSTRFVSGLSL